MGERVSEPPAWFSYGDLLQVRLKAYRNGNWRRLAGFEKAFFKASMELARLRGRIVNPSLLKAVKAIISKLLQTPVIRILQTGKGEASRLLKLYGGNGFFKWVPRLKNWLKDPEYVLWLGVRQLALRSVGYG